MFDHFKRYADDNSTLDMRAFRMAFYHLLTTHMGGSKLHDFNSFVDNLFEHFDEDDSGSVDFRETVAGLSVMCAGSGEDKVKSAFNLYDANGDSFISFEEMKNYLTSVFKVIFEAQPNVRRSMGNVLPEDLGVTTAEQDFEEADLNHDGKISFEEFAKWQNTSSFPGGMEGDGSGVPTRRGSAQVIQKLHDALSYEGVRKITHLDQIDAADFSRPSQTTRMMECRTPTFNTCCGIMIASVVVAERTFVSFEKSTQENCPPRCLPLLSTLLSLHLQLLLVCVSLILLFLFSILHWPSYLYTYTSPLFPPDLLLLAASTLSPKGKLTPFARRDLCKLWVKSANVVKEVKYENVAVGKGIISKK